MIVFLTTLVAAGLALLWYDFLGQRERNLPAVTPAALPAKMASKEPGLLASGLEIPWSLDFLPDGRILVTERPGRVRVVHPQSGLVAEPLLTVEDVRHQGEGGLLGLAVDPEFVSNRRVYLYYTYASGQGLANRVVAYTLEKNMLRRERVVIDGIPGSRIHNGGRLRFGQDGLLYITTGDAGDPESAQALTSLAGKILRLHPDGSIPTDNPFANSPVYSYGHRNPQGLAWDNAGRLWATEHGPSGEDEINWIEAGKNYGWPVIHGDAQAAGMAAPVRHSGADTWAPSGAAVIGNSLYFAGLRGRALYEFKLDRQSSAPIRHLDAAFGRLREVVAAGGFLYILTNNRDGRGVPGASDDLLLIVNPAAFSNSSRKADLSPAVADLPVALPPAAAAQSAHSAAPQ